MFHWYRWCIDWTNSDFVPYACCMNCNLAASYRNSYTGKDKSILDRNDPAQKRFITDTRFPYLPCSYRILGIAIHTRADVDPVQIGDDLGRHIIIAHSLNYPFVKRCVSLFLGLFWYWILVFISDSVCAFLSFSVFPFTWSMVLNSWMSMFICFGSAWSRSKCTARIRSTYASKTLPWVVSCVDSILSRNFSAGPTAAGNPLFDSWTHWRHNHLLPPVPYHRRIFSHAAYPPAFFLWWVRRLSDG